MPIPTSCAPLKTDIRDGNRIEARHAINGGPSVLYDAVALLTSEKAMLRLIADSATRDFISDAFAHPKFIAYAESAERLITAVIGDNNLDRGFIQIKTTDDAALFVKACQKLRFWERKSQVQVKEQVQNAMRCRASSASVHHQYTRNTGGGTRFAAIRK